jgi:hypothetical protein
MVGWSESKVIPVDTTVAIEIAVRKLVRSDCTDHNCVHSCVLLEAILSKVTLHNARSHEITKPPLPPNWLKLTVVLKRTQQTESNGYPNKPQ